jgi:hypothetical protein
LLRREVIPCWGLRSVHEISRRHVIELVTEVAARGTPSAANKLLKVVKTFLGWCVGARDLGPLAGGAGAGTDARKSA